MFSEGNYAHPIGCESPAESNGSLAHFFFKFKLPKSGVTTRC
jgi:hypothetical protein